MGKVPFFGCLFLGCDGVLSYILFQFFFHFFDGAIVVEAKAKQDEEAYDDKDV